VAGFPTVGCCAGVEIEAGTYALPCWFGIPLELEVPEGWRVINESRAGLLMLGRGANELGNPDRIVLLVDATAAGMSSETLINGIVGVPQVEAVSEASPVVLAGFDGSQARMNALPNPDYEGDPEADIPPGVQPLPAIGRFFAEGFQWTTTTPEAQISVAAVGVGDRMLLVYLEAPPGELDALASDAIPMLETLSLTP
jgi:hypothetical protein